jgi:biopolymer transport protein ExbD
MARAFQRNMQNRPVPTETEVIEIGDTNTLPINDEPPNLDEIRTVIKELKNGKAPDSDNITTALLRADPKTSAKEIHRILKKYGVKNVYQLTLKRG